MTTSNRKKSTSRRKYTRRAPTDVLGGGAKRRQWREVRPISKETAQQLAKDGLGQFTTLRVNEINIDRSYQRPFKDAWAQLIARGFDPSLFEPLHVGLRADNQYYVVDGQHRLEAAKLLGLKTVPVLLFIDSEEQNEASQFVRLQQGHLALSAFEQFHARLVAKDMVAVGVNTLLQKYGYSIPRSARSRTKGQFSCVNALENAYRKEPMLLDTILHIIHDTWGMNNDALAGKIVVGLQRFLEQYGTAIDIVPFKERLRSLAPSDLIMRAAIISKSLKTSMNNAMAQSMLELYNHKRNKNRLGGSLL